MQKLCKSHRIRQHNYQNGIFFPQQIGPPVFLLPARRQGALPEQRRREIQSTSTPAAVTSP